MLKWWLVKLADTVRHIGKQSCQYMSAIPCKWIIIISLYLWLISACVTPSVWGPWKYTWRKC